MRRTRYQFGTVERKKRKHGPDVWVLRYYMQNEEGSRSYASRIIGTTKGYPTRAGRMAFAKTTSNRRA